MTTPSIKIPQVFEGTVYIISAPYSMFFTIATAVWRDRCLLNVLVINAHRRKSKVYEQTALISDREMDGFSSSLRHSLL